MRVKAPNIQLAGTAGGDTGVRNAFIAGMDWVLRASLPANLLLPVNLVHLDKAARICIRHRLLEFPGNRRVVLLDDEACDLRAFGGGQGLELLDDFNRAHAWKLPAFAITGKTAFAALTSRREAACSRPVVRPRRRVL